MVVKEGSLSNTDVRKQNDAVPIGMSQVLAQWVTSKGKVGDPRMELFSHATTVFPCLGKKLNYL